MIGGSYVAVWERNESIGGAEGNAGFTLIEDIFFPRGRQDNRPGWVEGEGGWMLLMAWLKARAVRQTSMGSWAVPNHGRVPARVCGGSEAGIVNVNQVVLGRGTARSSVLRLQ